MSGNLSLQYKFDSPAMSAEECDQWHVIGPMYDFTKEDMKECLKLITEEYDTVIFTDQQRKSVSLKSAKHPSVPKSDALPDTAINIEMLEGLLYAEDYSCFLKEHFNIEKNDSFTLKVALNKKAETYILIEQYISKSPNEPNFTPALWHNWSR